MPQKTTTRHQSSEPKGRDITRFVRKNRSGSSLAQADLDSILPLDNAAPAASDTQVVTIDMDKIELDSTQPRKFANDYQNSDEHRELTETIREHGLLQPLLVRGIKPDKNGNPRAFQLVAGERRYRAARSADLKAVPAIVKDLNDEQVLEIQIIENTARKDLNDSETANAIRRLAIDFGLTQTEIARRTGKNQSDISRLLRVFHDATLSEYVEDGKITYSQAREIIAAKDAATKKQLADAVAERRGSKQPVELPALRHAVRTGKPDVLRNPSGFSFTRRSTPATSDSPTPSERAKQMVEDVRLAASLWNGVAVQLEHGKLAAPTQRDVREALERTRSALERIDAELGETERVRLAG